MNDTARTVVCVDFGSTFTKAVLVDLDSGDLLATAGRPTTLPDAEGVGDVLDGYDACLAVLRDQDPRAADADVLACSSAGGGLRIAVVGNEELVTAEAGRRVALSSGGKVVLVLFGGLDAAGLAELRAAEPDVVLLVGGTDGGNAEVLEGDAAFLARTPWPGPVVVAGNIESQPRVAALLATSGTPHVLADNVVPRIGVLAPDSARRAIREIFLSHVIGGKHLSSRTDARGRTFVDLVRGATPDVVLTGVELLARGLDDQHPGAGDVVVVDVGGATTDVHSVVELDPEDSGLAREVVATTPVTRTVEGDLGMRWSAVSTVEAAGRADLSAAAVRRRAHPDFLPPDAHERDVDLEIAAAAVRIALERHAGRSKVVVSPSGRVVERSGKDLREVDLMVGSGGVLRHGGPDAVRRVLLPATGDAFEGGWQLPRDPVVVVDRDYVLAAAGLLAEEHPVTAHRLLGRLRGAGIGSVADVTQTQAPEPDDEAGRRRLFPPLGFPPMGRTEDDDRLTERIVAQWAQVRAERRAEPAFTTGPSNFSRAQVPWGLDLAAAWSWRLIVIVVASLGLLWTMRYFAVITLPLAIALLGAALAIPLVHGLRRIGLPRGPAAGIVMVLGISTVALLLTFVGQQVAQGANDLADSVVTGLGQVRDWLRTGPLGISDSQLDSYIKETQSAITDSTGTDGVVTRVTEVGTAVGHVVAGFFIVLFSTYFFLADGDRIWAWMVRLAPRAARERVDASGRVAWVSLTQFVRATVLVALADAVGIMLVAFFLGVPFVFALGVLVFLGAFVPMIGATVAGTVAILVALVDQGPWTALLMLGGVILVQQIEGHILQPFLMGRFVSLHPLGVIVAIGCGVLVAGIAGALIAVPLAAAGNAVAQHLATYTGVGDDAEDALLDDLATDGVPPDEVPDNDSPVGDSAERDPHPDHVDDLSTLKDKDES